MQMKGVGVATGGQSINSLKDNFYESLLERLESNPEFLNYLCKILESFNGDREAASQFLHEATSREIEKQRACQASLDAQRITDQIAHTQALESAKQYSKTVVAIGYAGFFGLWVLLEKGNFVPPFWYALSALFVGVSLFLYVCHDVVLMQWNVWRQTAKAQGRWLFLIFHLVPTLLGFGGFLLLAFFLLSYLVLAL